MQIINSSESGLSASEFLKPMVAAPNNLNLIKNMSPSDESKFNSTHSVIPATSPSAFPSYTTNFQDVRRENVVLIPASSSLEQYRLQLYNYAMSIDRLRCPPYTAATTITAAAAYASGAGAGVHLLVNGENNHNFGSIEVETENSYASNIANMRSGRPFAPAAMTHGNRLALSMSLFPQRIFHPEEPKPQYSYIGLIAMGILSSAEAKLVLSDIYQYILDHYPYFRARGPGWRNSIRHNLSLNDCFIKSGRSSNGKGHYWAIHPANIDDFRKGDFRRRKAQRKVRKHMGLSLDDASNDSPSPPPLDLTSTPMTPAHLLRLAPAVNNLTTGHEFMTAPSTHAFGCLPTSLLSLQTQQQMQGNYFGAAIMEQYTCLPTTDNNNHPLSKLQQQQQFDHHKSINGGQPYNLTYEAKALPLCAQKSMGDLQRHSKSIIIANPTTTSVASNTDTTEIANIYSQTRKRQFDVASLLAPDRKDFTQKAPTTDRIAGAKYEEITSLQPTLQKRVRNENRQDDPQQQQDSSIHTHSLHTSQQFSCIPTLCNFAETNPQKLLLIDEQDLDDIDVVAHDFEEQTKQEFSMIYEDDNGNSYSMVKEEDKEEQTCITDTKFVDSTSCQQLYVDADVDATLRKTSNTTQQKSPLPGTVLEWHMLRQQSTMQGKRFPQIPVTSFISQKGYRECYATKIISSTTVTPIAATKAIVARAATECNSEGRVANINLNQLEIHPKGHNAIIQGSLKQRNQHMRRLKHHFEEQHQHHEALKELDDKTTQAFGRYYDTNMAAPSARRIGTMQLTQIQRQLPVKHPATQ